ncbi:NDR1/HIN1-like protein 10 [Camellia lanceoleosa]|uniref:NDR1/HIN1-like protein 10 n=1 Tax=Camellia lanceoleosa TaxID=1840588 RepID=A0ACC0FW34_9ERIC|nr:NDR1/HIN1-like protein 10 [Camellia lanceoleosa]
MASNTGADERDQNKPVTCYPSQAGQVATGYPRASPLVDSAYFYSPPPPSPYFAAVVSPAPFYPPLRRSNSSFLLLLRLLSAMLFVFLLIGTILFISWSVVRPRLPEFSVSSAFASPLNATSSDLSATLDLSIVVANPNTKFCILYDRIEASVFYGDGFLVSQSKLAPFQQAKLNQTLVSARMAIVGANVGNNVVKEILEDKRNGTVSFGVRVLAVVRFRSGGWLTRKRLMRVYCYDVEIGHSASAGDGSGSLLTPSKECENEPCSTRSSVEARVNNTSMQDGILPMILQLDGMDLMIGFLPLSSRAQFWNNLKARSCYATFGCNNGSDVALKNNLSPLLIVMTYCLEVALFLGSG